MYLYCTITVPLEFRYCRCIASTYSSSSTVYTYGLCNVYKFCVCVLFLLMILMGILFFFSKTQKYLISWPDPQTSVGFWFGYLAGECIASMRFFPKTYLQGCICVCCVCVFVCVCVHVCLREDIKMTSSYPYCPVLSLSICGALEVKPSALLVPGRT